MRGKADESDPRSQFIEPAVFQHGVQQGLNEILPAQVRVCIKIRKHIQEQATVQTELRQSGGVQNVDAAACGKLNEALVSLSFSVEIELLDLHLVVGIRIVEADHGVQQVTGNAGFRIYQKASLRTAKAAQNERLPLLDHSLRNFDHGFSIHDRIEKVPGAVFKQRIPTLAGIAQCHVDPAEKPFLYRTALRVDLTDRTIHAVEPAAVFTEKAACKLQLPRGTEAQGFRGKAAGAHDIVLPFHVPRVIQALRSGA